MALGMPENRINGGSAQAAPFHYLATEGKRVARIRGEGDLI